MENNIVRFNSVESKIIDLRGQKVILDSDVAALYGVETREINQAVKNNPEKFPDGYIFQISKEEKDGVIKNFDNPNVKFAPRLPVAFTEKGLYMLATILKGERAVQTTSPLWRRSPRYGSCREPWRSCPGPVTNSPKKT